MKIGYLSYFLVVILFTVSCFTSCTKNETNANADSPLSSITAQVQNLTIPFQSILPNNVEVFIPKSNPGSYVVYGELNGKPGNEAVTFLQHPDYPSQLYMAVFSEEEEWSQKVWFLIQGDSLDWLYLDKQFVYVGLTLPNNKKELYVYFLDTYKAEWSVERINEIQYEKLQILDLPGRYGNDGRPEIARWIHDENDREQVQLFRLNSWEYNFNFIYAFDSYPYFFPSVVETAKKELLTNPSNIGLEIQLAKYETYAHQSQNAINRIKQLLTDSNIIIPPDQEQFLVELQCQCLNQLEQYEEAEIVLQNFIPLIQEDDSFQSLLLKKNAYIDLQESLLQQKKYSASQRIWEIMPKISEYVMRDNGYEISYPPQIDEEPKANYVQRFNLVQEYIDQQPFQQLIRKWSQFQTWGQSQDPTLVISDLLSASLLTEDYSGLFSFQVEEMGMVIAWAEKEEVFLTPFYYIDSFSHKYNLISAPEKMYANNNSLGIIFNEKPTESLTLRAYQFLHKENHRWNISWTSPFYPNGTLHITEPNLEMLTAKGQIVLDPSGKGYIFGECDSSTYHRFYQDIWLQEQDLYVLLESNIINSPYQTLVDYLFYLYNDDIESAKELVSSSKLIDQTIQLEIVGNTDFYSCPRWIQNSKEDIIVFRIKNKENVAFYFSHDENKYVIQRIVINPDDITSLPSDNASTASGTP